MAAGGDKHQQAAESRGRGGGGGRRGGCIIQFLGSMWTEDLGADDWP